MEMPPSVQSGVRTRCETPPSVRSGVRTRREMPPSVQSGARTRREMPPSVQSQVRTRRGFRWTPSAKRHSCRFRAPAQLISSEERRQCVKCWLVRYPKPKAPSRKTADESSRVGEGLPQPFDRGCLVVGKLVATGKVGLQDTEDCRCVRRAHEGSGKLDRKAHGTISEHSDGGHGMRERVRDNRFAHRATPSRTGWRPGRGVAQSSRPNLRMYARFITPTRAM